MLSLKLWRRVRQKLCESKVPVGGRIADVDIPVCVLGRIVVVRVNHGISVGGARTTVVDSSVPVALRGRGIGWDYSIGMV